ncbi:MAG: hypothetical protein KDB14_26840 [Planctomycetales bacterium]|nr:hypothetical protein [Planctomycetales bacterium]
MIPAPAEILARIKDGDLLPPAAIAALDHDAILDERDGDDAFEAEWTRCYNEIEKNWAAADLDHKMVGLKDDIRRESFLSVSRATTRHEIASYVSDDFDIIVRGSILGMNDPFLNALWDVYNRNEIPGPGTGK